MAGAGIAFAQEAQEDDEAQVGLPAAQVVRAINAAVGAKAGQVAEVEIERENNRVQCEVKILAGDGKAYEITVNPADGQVLSVELDDEDGGEEGEAG